MTIGNFWHKSIFDKQVKFHKNPNDAKNKLTTEYYTS